MVGRIGIAAITTAVTIVATMIATIAAMRIALGTRTAAPISTATTEAVTSLRVATMSALGDMATTCRVLTARPGTS